MTTTHASGHGALFRPYQAGFPLESGFAPRWYVPHGAGRDLTTGEAAPAGQP
jgi:hypothetical protein